MKYIPITKAVKIKNQRVKHFEGKKRYLATGGLIKNKIKTEDVDYETKPSRADLEISENQLIVARMKGTNKVLHIDNAASDIIVSTGFLILEPQENWSPRFLFHFFESNFFQDQKDKLSIGATQKAINNNKFKEIIVPNILPKDQERIAKILDAADALRQKRKQAITLLDDYLKSVFLDMFGDPMLNPKGWRSKEISELCRVKIGPFGSLLHKSDYIPDGIPLVNPKHMINGKIVVDPENCISKEKHNQLKDYHLKTGDLIMARRGEIGRCAVVTPQEDKFLCGTGSIFLRPEGEVNNVFLHYLFTTESMVRVFENGANGVTMQNLNANTVKKTNIIYPPIDLQNKFSDIFTKTSELKKVMITQSAELETGFQALMKKAFKGEL